MATKLTKLTALTPDTDDVIEISPADATIGMPAIHADAQELRRILVRRKIAALMTAASAAKASPPKAPDTPKAPKSK